MTQDWSRRQLLKSVGVAAAGAAGAGAAGLNLSGCGTRAARPAGEPTAAGGVRQFASRPDLAPPLVTLRGNGSPAGPGYIMLATVASGPGQGGAMIMRKNGELVWFGQDRGNSKMNLSVQEYKGKPMLTWWEGRILPAGYGEGVAVIADSAYQVIHTVHAANGLKADLHEFYLTPHGTALVTAYRTVKASLSAAGGPSRGSVVSGVAQEIDIATGKLLFEWDSLDHVGLDESYQKFSGGTASEPYNYFHINSVALAPDGDLLISARNTWTIYKVSRANGAIVWRMHGKKSDFTFGPGARYYWQHDVRPHGSDKLSLFDNGSEPAVEKQSRAIVLKVDAAKRHVTLDRQYVHPGYGLLSNAMGSAQLLPDGRMFVGWGTNPDFSEFASDGKPLLDGAITKEDPSYRARLADWTGHPTERPALAAHASAGGATVHASWNGATQVATWTVLAGKTRSSLAPVAAVRRSGFETTAAVASRGPYFAVKAHDAAGRLLARSATVLVTKSAKRKSKRKTYGCGSSNCGY